MPLHRALLLVLAAACAPPDGGPAPDDDEDAGGDVADAGALNPDGGVVAPAFTYEEIPGAVCGNGTPTGLGRSDAPLSSSQLVVIINGGGACWDNVGCFGLNAAAHIWDTYSADMLQADLAPFLPSGILDRDGGPFSTAHMAFVPYCTGDLHAGNATRDYQADLFGQDIRTVHHAGRTNMELFAEVLRADLPFVDEIFLVGISAGGFGAYLDADVFRGVFPSATVHVLADCAPFVPPQNGLFGTWNAQWSMALPVDCAECTTDFGAIVTHVIANGPDARHGLVATTNDEVIRAYFGYGANDMTPQVLNVQATQFAAANAKAFVVTGTQHVLLGGYGTAAAPTGETLKAWFDGFVAGGDRWTSVTP